MEWRQKGSKEVDEIRRKEEKGGIKKEKEEQGKVGKEG